MPESRTDPEREQVASQARHWVRIARACNNRCAFCLDSNVQDGSFLDRDEVERDLRSGLDRGARRLILSGGEASIHPDFLYFVQRGRDLGYEHVQTITNGRMFAYPRFTAAAVAAGLDEVTFSLHGHTAGLHDSLTGVPGSFDQGVAGIRRAVATGRLIVSGDVVINRRNVDHLREVMDLFISLGVRELDLLMVTPFGRAAPGGVQDMLFDPETALGALRRGLDLSRDPGLHIWTNRLAPQLLEGFEDLIQDPHKLHDEVRGRRDILEEMVSGGTLRCQGERCAHCFIQPLCQAMRGAIDALDRRVPERLLVDAADPRPTGDRATLVGLRREVLWVRARDARQATRTAAGSRAAKLWFELDDLTGLPGSLRGAGLRQPVRIVARDREQVCEAAGMDVSEVAIPMTKATFDVPFPPESAIRTIAFLPPAFTLREAIDLGADPASVWPTSEPDSCPGVPPCLGGTSDIEYADPLPLSVVRSDGSLDPDAFVTHFIGRLYRVKSLRCRGCIHDAVCRGLEIQRVRAAGLGILQPVAG